MNVARRAVVVFVCRCRCCRLVVIVIVLFEIYDVIDLHILRLAYAPASVPTAPRCVLKTNANPVPFKSNIMLAVAAHCSSLLSFVRDGSYR